MVLCDLQLDVANSFGDQTVEVFGEDVQSVVGPVKNGGYRLLCLIKLQRDTRFGGCF